MNCKKGMNGYGLRGKYDIILRFKQSTISV